MFKKKYLGLVILLLAVLLQFGCRHSSKKDVPFVCHVDPKYERINLKGASGCLIENSGKILMVQNRQGKKLSLPGGVPRGQESSQCTAARETFMETGLNVTVGKLVHHFENGFYFFACDMEQKEKHLRMLKVSGAEISRVMFVNPQQLTEDDLRFPNDLKILQQLN